jgi:uncharacterized protein YkwD
MAAVAITGLVPGVARAQSSSTVLPAAGNWAPGQYQKATLDAVNVLRAKAGLSPLRLDPRLCAAASGHSIYLTANHVFSHQEQPGRPGFVATEPSDRAAHYGFSGGCLESVSQSNAVIADAVGELFDAPYHRSAFLQPGNYVVGVGGQGNVSTLLWEQSQQSGLTVYPADGETGVPTSWTCSEMPSPLRMHPAAHAGPVGYPITAFSFSPDGLPIGRIEAIMTTKSGAIVPTFVNTPENDDFLTNGVIIIPSSPLRPSTAYCVTLRTAGPTTGTGPILRAWSFTTAAGPALAKH